MLPYSLKRALTFSLSFDNVYITLRLMQGLKATQEQSQSRTSDLTPSQVLFPDSILPLLLG